MKLVIAMDSFKGSISSLEAGNAVRKAAEGVIPNVNTVVLPLADGGEGTAYTLTYGMGGSMRHIKVKDPLGRSVTASYGTVPQLGIAVIEIAQAAGLVLIPAELRNPMLTTTFGVGEMISDAMDLGYRNFIIGLGGSGTNDAGLGMLTALGYKFFDADGNPVGISGKDTCKVSSADISEADPRLAECKFKIACDVNNPLCGSNGASAVFGPQKGASPDMVAALDEGLRSFASISDKALGCSHSLTPGAGAAGGLGYAFLAYLNASVHKGVDVVLEAVNAEEAIKDADIVVTGEGKIDAQTLMGKAPAGVAALAKKYGKMVIAFAGAVDKDVVDYNGSEIDAVFSIQQCPISLEDAMCASNAADNLRATAIQVFKLLRCMIAQ